MGKFIVQRFMWMLLVLLIVAATTFVLMHAVPGGPFSREKPLPAQTIAQLNEKYNLDDPLIVQFLDYVGDILIPVIMTGEQSRALDHEYLINVPLPVGENARLRWMNFGPSFKSTSRTVNDIFRENFPISFQLGMMSFILATAIGIPLGILSALKRNTIYDFAGMSLAIIGVSVPVIIIAPILQYTFGVRLQWLPLTGWGNLNQMILPVVTLGFGQAAIIARLTRASLLQVLSEDFMRTARVKGLSERRVIGVHALKNSVIPIVTIFGPMVAYLVTGTFVVETIFGIPGMGRFFVTSITGRDYPVIMGTILIFAFLLVVANTVVDIAYVYLDPRIRYDR
jgi:ABC-type dipeptide/oligopeptide/nickel transport system permease component